MSSANERGRAKVAEILMDHAGAKPREIFTAIGLEMGSLILEVEELKDKVAELQDKYDELIRRPSFDIVGDE